MFPRSPQFLEQERMANEKNMIPESDIRLKTIINKDFSTAGVWTPYIKRQKVYYSFTLSWIDYNRFSHFFEEPQKNYFFSDDSMRHLFKMALKDISKVCEVQFVERNYDFSLSLYSFNQQNIDTDWAGLTILSRAQHYIFIKLNQNKFTPNVIHTIYHELGHALGLDHPFEAITYVSYPDQKRKLEKSVTSMMNYQAEDFIFNTQAFFMGDTDEKYIHWGWSSVLNFPFYSKPILSRLGPLDIEALQVMYGRNLETHKDNTVYELSPMSEAMPMSDLYITLDTIWDAGGVDTLSAKGVTDPVVLNLREGPYQWSLIFKGGDTKALFSLAYESNIENIIGGKLNTIYLNALNNNVDVRESTFTMAYSEFPMGHDTIFGFHPYRDKVIFEKMPSIYYKILPYKKIKISIAGQDLVADYGTEIYFNSNNSLILANVNYSDLLESIDKNIFFELAPRESIIEFIILAMYAKFTPQFQLSFMVAFARSVMLNSVLLLSETLAKTELSRENIQLFHFLFQCSVALLALDFKSGMALSLGIALCHQFLPQLEGALIPSNIIALTSPIIDSGAILGAVSGSIATNIVAQCRRLFCFGKKHKSDGGKQMKDKFDFKAPSF